MKKYLIGLFVLGVIFRLWIANLVPQPLVFDQIEYHNFAVKMLDNGLYAWRARLFGYPLLLTFIYKIFGIGNFGAVAIVQSILDCSTALLVFILARKIFKNSKVAWISYLLYLFNPFTSVYVTLVLSEVLAIFLVTVIIYLLIQIGGRTQKAWPPRKLFLITFLLGFLPQVRPAFLFYAVIVFFWLIIWVIRKMGIMRAVLPSILSMILFILPFTYNIAGNWVYFRQFAPTTVDNLFVREFYISLYVTGRSPFHANSSAVFPKEVQAIYSEYSVSPLNTTERKTMADKYLNLGIQKVKNYPLEFIFSRISKFWYVWEKHFLFYYTQPENKLVDFLTYWGNNLLILLAIAGFMSWFRKITKSHLVYFGWLIIFTIGYISLVHSFSLTEERYSLPGYPFIFLFAAYGIWRTINTYLG